MNYPVGQRVGKCFLLLPLAVLWMASPTSGTHTTAQCAQLGQANANILHQLKYADLRRHGPWTVGAKNFDIQYSFLDLSAAPRLYWDSSNAGKMCPYGPCKTPCHLFFDPCPPDSVVEIRTYTVEQDGTVLNGWLHFELELMDKSDKILAIYVQVRDEYFNAVGEFVGKAEEQCTSVKDHLAQPSQYQVLPCSAVGFREAKEAHALFMADKSILVDSSKERLLSNESISEGIHFTWRLSEYWCSRHLRLRPEAIIFTEKMIAAADAADDSRSPKPYRKAAPYWIHHGWYGAADIKLPATTLSCEKPAIDYKTGKITDAAPWLTKVSTPSMLENDYIYNDQLYIEVSPITGKNRYSLKSCQVDVRPAQPKSVDDPANDVVPTFGGRCNDYLSKETSHDNLQGCNLNDKSPEFKAILDQFPHLGTYSNYVNTLYLNRTKLCSRKCQIPTVADLKDIRNFTDHSNESLYTSHVHYNEDSRNDTKIEKLFSGKKYHAALCIIWTMLLTPVGIFCARYLKETCMQLRCTGIHFWFWVHMATSLAAPGLFISAILGLWQNLNTWGRSEHPQGIVHRRLGYLSIAVFCLMLFLGGFRGLNRVYRITLATLHSALGFLVYFLNVAAILNSAYIPASPSMDECDQHGHAKGASGLFVVCLCWLLVDLCIHIAMTVIQYFKDREVGVERRWWCPIFPFLPHDSADDMIGSRLRKLMLIIYATSAFIMTNAALGLIMNSKLSPRCQALTGPLSCKNKWGCSESAQLLIQLIKKRESGHNGTYKHFTTSWIEEKD